MADRDKSKPTKCAFGFQPTPAATNCRKPAASPKPRPAFERHDIVRSLVGGQACTGGIVPISLYGD